MNIRTIIPTILNATRNVYVHAAVAYQKSDTNTMIKQTVGWLQIRESKRRSPYVYQQIPSGFEYQPGPRSEARTQPQIG